MSFLAAAILYYFAVGDVKGFAFTLGLSTILDLVVVFLFTHPLVTLLARSKAFIVAADLRARLGAEDRGAADGRRARDRRSVPCPLPAPPPAADGRVPAKEPEQ